MLSRELDRHRSAFGRTSLPLKSSQDVVPDFTVRFAIDALFGRYRRGVADDEVTQFETQPHNRARVPRGVFEHGTEPDPLYSLANERTYLAWLRLALTLTASAIAVDRLFVDYPRAGDQVVSLALVGVAFLACAFGVHRWWSTELALRERRPLPGFGVPLLGSVAVIFIGCGVVVLILQSTS